MLATTAPTIPAGPAWVHEVKWDGMRVLADVHHDQRPGGLRLTSRTGREVTIAFPELAPLAETYADLLLDGEVVALRDGRPSFGALADRMHVTSARRAARLAAETPVTYVIFDLVRLFGQDLTGQPWSARRALLERLELSGPHWQVPPTHDDGTALAAATLDQGLEGVVSKRRASPYTPGRRSPDWLKSPHRRRLSVVVLGWRPEVGSDRLGAVLVGEPDAAGGWRFAGRVGSGLAGSAGVALARRLARLTTAAPAADGIPALDAEGTTWTRPELVIEVESLGRSEAGRLRQPSYQGVRPDLTAADLTAEPPADPPAEKSRPDA